jgi:hypothetical protein
MLNIQIGSVKNCVDIAPNGIDVYTRSEHAPSGVTLIFSDTVGSCAFVYLTNEEFNKLRTCEIPEKGQKVQLK